MGAWTLPAAAVAFACGLLAWPFVEVDPPISFACGLGALTAAWLTAAGLKRGPGPLVRARLLPPSPGRCRPSRRRRAQ